MNLAISRTVSRLVTGRGCGLWTTMESGPLTNCTLEPARSLTTTPSALSSDSISFHLMSGGVGVAFILSNVRWWRLLITRSYATSPASAAE